MKTEVGRAPRARSARRDKHPDPWIEAFIGTDPEPANLVSAIKKLARPLPTKLEATLILLKVALGRRRLEDHLPLINRAFRERSCIDLHILFLVAWFRALVFFDPDWSKLRIVRDRMLSLTSDSTPVEVVAWVRFAEALTAYQLGDARSAMRLIDGVVAGLTPESPHYRRLTTLRVMFYCLQGMAAVVQLPTQLEPLGSIYQRRLYIWRAVNCALTGVIDPMLRAAAGEPSSEPIADLRQPAYQAARHALNLMAKHRGLPALALPSLPDEPVEPAWVSSTRALLTRQPHEALDWARRQVRQQSTRAGSSNVRSVVGFDEYALIRAELALGNGEAARHLLNRRSKKGSIHFIDDLFYARAELLAGHADRAARHFARLLGLVERYRAAGRFNFETDLACELSATQLVDLSRRATALLDRGFEGDEIEPAPGDAPPELGHVAASGVRRLVGASDAMKQLREHVVSFSKHELPVLITGETGTGKELVAHALHEAGPRADEPFIAINCGALADALVESELFGHERGAFTGAQMPYKGLFREAGAGTIFLDEIGDITPKLQLALLRVLENNEIRPVGSSRRYPISCRIIAATNADLEDRVRNGSFRKDLFYRLLRLEVQLLPLRARPGDIEPLALHFLNHDRAATHRATITGALREAMHANPWPGNARELRNMIERMRVLRSDKLLYDIEDLQAAVAPTGDQSCQAQSAHNEAAMTPIASKLVPSIEPVAEVTADAARDPGAMDQYLAAGRSALRRRKRLEQLFVRAAELKTNEVAELLGVSRATARLDLQQLCRDGVVIKVTPTACRSSHYYRRVEATPAATATESAGAEARSSHERYP